MAAGARDVHVSGGSVQCESESTIFSPAKASVSMLSSSLSEAIAPMSPGPRPRGERAARGKRSAISSCEWRRIDRDDKIFARGGAVHVDDILTVVRIVDLGSFSQAAEFLGMSQSNVSHRVHQVERELGTSLFIRE